MHIGYDGADTELDSVVAIINRQPEVNFTLVSGDNTEKGRNAELETVKEILDKLEMPYYIIPGNHDTKWSESGTSKFSELWKSDKFSFEFNGDFYIGLNSGIPWRGGGGHIAPEDLNWLEKQLRKTTPGQDIYFVVHHPLDESIDNWFKVTNILRDYNIHAIYHGHGHKNKISAYNKIPGVMSRSTLSKGEKSYGFTLVENRQDSIYFFEVDGLGKFRNWGNIVKSDNRSIPLIDSSNFRNYDTELISQINLNSTLSASLYVNDSKIYSAAKNGILSCFDTTGTLLWEYDCFGDVMSKPVSADGILAVATVQGDLITLDANTGQPLQTIGFDEAITSQLITINHTGNKNLMIPKQTNSDAAVIVGTASGKIYCFDLETLQQIWVNETPKGMIETEPLLINNKIIFGSWDGYLYCIEEQTGSLIWRWQDNKSFYYAPAACKPVSNGENVYIATSEKKVYAINLLLGKTEWESSKFEAWESIGISDIGHRIFVKSFEDKFHIASAKTSNWVKELNLKFGLDTMPVEPIEWNGNILFGGKNGFIYLIDENFRYKKILFLGTARVHTVKHIKDNMFAASNMDGTIAIFKIN